MEAFDIEQSIAENATRCRNSPWRSLNSREKKSMLPDSRDF
jgi:hypothetical protein